MMDEKGTYTTWKPDANLSVRLDRWGENQHPVGLRQNGLLPEWDFFLLAQGRIRALWNGRPLMLHSGQSALLWPGDRFETRMLTEVRVRWAHFALRCGPSPALVCGAPRQRRSVAKDRLGADLFAAFLAKAPGSRCLFEAELLRRLVGEGIGRVDQRLRPRERPSLRSLVAQQVEQHPGRRLELREFSDLLGCHPGSLSARFRREEGMTFSRALLHARLENVRPLLESGRPLAELAEACGYADAFAFSKAWKTCYGAAPRGTQAR